MLGIVIHVNNDNCWLPLNAFRELSFFYPPPMQSLRHRTRHSLFVHLSGFVGHRLCTSSMVQSYIVHHRPALCTIVQKGGHRVQSFSVFQHTYKSRLQCSSVPIYTQVVHSVALYSLGGIHDDLFIMFIVSYHLHDAKCDVPSFHTLSDIMVGLVTLFLVLLHSLLHCISVRVSMYSHGRQCHAST